MRRWPRPWRYESEPGGQILNDHSKSGNVKLHEFQSRSVNYKQSWIIGVSAAHLDVFLVVWDSGEELLPSHQLSKQLRSLLQEFDQRFDVVVDRLLMNLQKHELQT